MLKVRKIRIILAGLLLSSAAFAQKTVDWKISDYLQALPEAYKVFAGDFQIEPTKENTLIDDKNGYAAFFDRPIVNKEAYPIFEITLFKKANGEDLLVVSNMLSDPVCTFHRSFFLQRMENEWIDVESKVLPKLPPHLFFDSAKTSNYYLELQKKLGNSTELDLHFSPPRQGTNMTVNLEICDYVPDDFSEPIDFEKLAAKTRTVSLIWDKKTGMFKVN
jgi:hypothetical protein